MLSSSDSIQHHALQRVFPYLHFKDRCSCELVSWQWRQISVVAPLLNDRLRLYFEGKTKKATLSYDGVTMDFEFPTDDETSTLSFCRKMPSLLPIATEAGPSLPNLQQSPWDWAVHGSGIPSTSTEPDFTKKNGTYDGSATDRNECSTSSAISLSPQLEKDRCALARSLVSIVKVMHRVGRYIKSLAIGGKSHNSDALGLYPWIRGRIFREFLVMIDDYCPSVADLVFTYMLIMPQSLGCFLEPHRWRSLKRICFHNVSLDYGVENSKELELFVQNLPASVREMGFNDLPAKLAYVLCASLPPSRKFDKIHSFPHVFDLQTIEELNSRCLPVITRTSQAYLSINVRNTFKSPEIWPKLFSSDCIQYLELDLNEFAVAGIIDNIGLLANLTQLSLRSHCDLLNDETFEVLIISLSRLKLQMVHLLNLANSVKRFDVLTHLCQIKDFCLTRAEFFGNGHLAALASSWPYLYKVYIEKCPLITTNGIQSLLTLGGKSSLKIVEIIACGLISQWSFVPMMEPFNGVVFCRCLGNVRKFKPEIFEKLAERYGTVEFKKIGRVKVLLVAKNVGTSCMQTTKSLMRVCNICYSQLDRI